MSLPSVLFLCTHNAGRSQMAAGWLQHLGREGVEAFSAGSEPGDDVNATIVAAMREVGVDIAASEPKLWNDGMVRAADVIVGMGCGDVCPVYPGKRYLEWDLDDPNERPLEEVRLIRDDIEVRVRDLLGELGVPAGMPA